MADYAISLFRWRNDEITIIIVFYCELSFRGRNNEMAEFSHNSNGTCNYAVLYIFMFSIDFIMMRGVLIPYTGCTHTSRSRRDTQTQRKLHLVSSGPYNVADKG